MNKFFEAIAIISNYAHKANTHTLPSITLNFKSKRDKYYFINELKMDWPKDTMPPKYYHLNKFQLHGIDINITHTEIFNK